MNQKSETLEEFRRLKNGKNLIQCLKEKHWVIFNWTIGFGKSTAIDRIIRFNHEHRVYDLIIYMASQHNNIHERIDNNILIPYYYIMGRPSSDKCPHCEDLNFMMTRHLNTLAKEKYCIICQNSECSWGEKNKGLIKEKVIYTVVDFLAVKKDFIQNIARRTGAKKILVLVDEDKLISLNFERVITKLELEMYCNILNILIEGNKLKNKNLILMRDQCLSLIKADTSYLRNNPMSHKTLSPKIKKMIQQQGEYRYTGKFINLDYLFKELECSEPESRSVLNNGSIRFFSLPSFSGADVGLFTATSSPLLFKEKLQLPFVVDTSPKKLINKDTVWYNISSGEGSLAHFSEKVDRIFEMFSQLIVKRLKSKKRVLLIAKVKIIEMYLKILQSKLNELTGNEKYSVLWVRTSDIHSYDPNNLSLIPILNYGCIGVNVFSDFDCVFCLCSYNISSEDLNLSYQSHLSVDNRFSVKALKYKNRKIGDRVELDMESCPYDLDNKFLVEEMCNCMELDVILQAVGRCRPFTKPREVITFNRFLEVPGVDVKHFQTLGEVREHFKLFTRDEMKLKKQLLKIQECKERGLNQNQTAVVVGVSTRQLRNIQKKIINLKNDES